MAFWNKNKHDICPSEKDLKTLVTNYLGANSKIKVNSKVTVPEGYFCVLGRRGKVADKFDTGEHFLNFASMPYMCRRFGIDKVQDGKQKEKFSCECYFVSKGLIAGKFKTYRKVEMGTRAYGLYKAHVYGMYSYKVANAQELMQSLLNEYDYIKTGEAESIIESWVNDLIVSTLEKKNFVINDVVNNNPIIAAALKKSIAKLFETAGLEICELKIYKYKLPKQYQAASDEAIAKQIELENKNIVGQPENTEQQKSNEQSLAAEEKYSQNQANIENREQNNITDYYNGLTQPTVNTGNNQTNNDACVSQNLVDEQTDNDLANMLNRYNTTLSDNEKLIETSVQNQQQQNTIDETNQQEYNQNASNQVEQYVPFGNFVINKGSLDDVRSAKQDYTKQEQPQFVDLNLDNLYADKKTNTKRCLNCGAENGKTADHCLLCGEKFIEGDY